MRKLWSDAKAAKKPLLTLIVSVFLLTVFLTIKPISSVMEPGPGEGYATFKVSPASVSLFSPPRVVGDKFTVQVRLYDYDQVASWQAKLVYDKSLIDIASLSDLGYAPDHIFPPGTYAPIPSATGDFNATHKYAMMTAATFGAIEYGNFTTLEDSGLMQINFTIMSVPPKGTTASCVLWFQPDDSWTCDENVDENDEDRIDGYYEITTTKVNHLEVSPTEIILPEIEGDKIVGTDKAKFSMDILIQSITVSDDIILVQWELHYNGTVIDCTGVTEGSFMNNPVWAPYGTALGWAKDPHRVSGFILINPNSTEPSGGEWNWEERPTGSGTLVTVDFEVIYQPPAPKNVSFPFGLAGVFGEFFLNSSIEWVGYGPPVNGTFTLHGYNWNEPVASFSYSPVPAEVNKTVTFDASTSYGYENVDGALVQNSTYIETYTWDWDDGSTNTTTNPIITHNYTDLGTYTVNLTVTDYDGLTNSTSKAFFVMEVVNHTIIYEGQTFIVTTMSTGKIEKDTVVLDQKHKCLYFNVTGESDNLGIVNITIPNALLNAQAQEWMVILQMKVLTTGTGLIVTPVGTQNTMLSMAFTFGSEEQIFIFGTYVIPEFSGSTIMLAFMSMLLVAAAISLAMSKKRKK